MALALTSGAALAEYPEKEIQGIIQWGAGGSTDTVMRSVTPHAETVLDGTVVMQNMARRRGRDRAEPRGRPGALMLAASLAPLWSAYSISGVEALSAPGTVPMAMFVMVVTATLVVLRTARLPVTRDERFSRDILPAVVLIFAAFLVAYRLLLKPLGFLPTSALFLIATIKVLGKRSWGWTVLVSLGSLAPIWLVFRIIFTVLMPAGTVPEAGFCAG